MSNGGARSHRGGKLAVVISAVGGAGRTTFTANLAVLLAGKNKITVLDGDLQFGDLALALDLAPELTIKEAVERKETNYISEYFLPHQSGVQVLAAPVRPEYADLITADMLGAVIDAILPHTDLLLVEVQAGLNEQNLFLLEKSDKIFVVAEPGMAVLKNTKLLIETISVLGMEKKVEVIINKSTRFSTIKSAEIPALLQVETVCFIPDDPKRVPLSLDTGVPLVTSNPKLNFSKAIDRAGKQLFPEYYPVSSKADRKSRQQKFLKKPII